MRNKIIIMFMNILFEVFHIFFIDLVEHMACSPLSARYHTTEMTTIVIIQ